MTLVFTLLSMLVVAVAAGLATGRFSGGLPEAPTNLPYRGLPDGGITADDLRRLRFSTALRGYRPDQVDRALDVLAGELARRDAEVEDLRTRLTGADAQADSAPPSAPPR